MMMRGSGVMMLAAAMIAGVAAAQPANPFSDRLQRLPDIQKRAVLRRAILDSGQYCQRVDEGRAKGRWRNLTMWTARCSRGGDFAVFIGPDASVQVRPCKDLATLKLPACGLAPRAGPGAPRRR